MAPSEHAREFVHSVVDLRTGRWRATSPEQSGGAAEAAGAMDVAVGHPEDEEAPLSPEWRLVPGEVYTYYHDHM